MNAGTIDVCIATYRRPDGLRKLLQSLFDQEWDEGIRWRVVVIDNDPLCSARAVVDEMLSIGPVPLLYGQESTAGISSARNACFAMADAMWVAFVDDDEIVSKRWLCGLYNTAARYSADVVFGAVVPLIDDKAPDWIREGRFFERPRQKTGMPLKGGATNNVLMSFALVKKLNVRFDVSYNLTGNGDTEFFARLHRLGAHMVFCDEAEVFEEIPLQRCRWNWLVRRYYRGGQGYIRVYGPTYSASDWLAWGITRPIYAVVGLLAGGLMIAWSRGRGAAIVLRGVSSLGQLSSVFGRWTEEYARKGTKI